MSSHKYGLATDWIVGMTVVLANGTIARCSATENPNLFWALRGSGSNYGVVASYDFATFAAPTQVTYFNMPTKWNTTTAPVYLAAVENYTKAVMPADLTMRMFASSNQHYFEGLYYGDVAGLRTALKPLQDKIPGLAIQSATNTTWLKAFEHYANANTDPTTPYSTVITSKYNLKHDELTQKNVARNLLCQKSHAKKPQWHLIEQLRQVLVQQRSQKHPKLVVPT